MFNAYKLKNILGNQKILYLFLFLFVFSYFLWLNSSLYFSDPDAFYHAKMVELIKAHGLVKNFKWLPLTTLNENYIDHHLLYHLLVLPLTSFLPVFWAVKFAAALFAAGCLVVFQWFLDKFKIKFSWLYTFILLTAYQFIFRINLPKASALSLIWLIIFIYLIFNFKDKWSWKIFFLMGTYVWLYGGWVIALGVAVIYGLVATIFNWYHQFLEHQQTSFKFFLKNLFHLMPFKLLLNVSTGLLAGLVVNPYFPINLKFYWQQIIEIALVNYKNIIDVGGEWYATPLGQLIQNNVLVVILLLISFLTFFIYFKRQNKKTWTLFIISLVFAALTLKSRRNLEYFIPLSLLFCALTFNLFIKNWLQIKKNIYEFRKQHQLVTYILTFFLIFYLPILAIANFHGIKAALAQNYKLGQFQKVMLWLKAHSQTDTIVFHDRWDDWPVFFYYNTHNRYIIGLDPTFMYLKNPQLYQLWHKIVYQQIKQPCHLIQQKFFASFIFVKRENLKLNQIIKIDKACYLVYDDKDGWLYKIKP